MRGAYPAVIFGSGHAQSLPDEIQLKDGSSLISGAVDPSAVATTGQPGSLYLNSTAGTADSNAYIDYFLAYGFFAAGARVT